LLFEFYKKMSPQSNNTTPSHSNIKKSGFHSPKTIDVTANRPMSIQENNENPKKINKLLEVMN